ncbi:MAG: hypothetical protein IIA68_06155 [Proteobacteria bacterium]|nr:hypothetical protein [Pseudomonadota bacterium]
MSITEYAASGIQDGTKSRGRSGIREQDRASARQKKERVHVTMGVRSRELLDDLAEITECSYADVFRNSLRLYAAVIAETEKGNEFIVKDQNGNLTAYKIFI